MEASEFRPQYDSSVIEWLQDDPQGRAPVNISERYCLLPSSANVFATLFNPKPTLFLAPPWEQAAGSPFAFNHDVPWLDFGGDKKFNAALLASYWGMPGVRYQEAMTYAMKDVEGTW